MTTSQNHSKGRVIVSLQLKNSELLPGSDIHGTVVLQLLSKHNNSTITNNNNNNNQKIQSNNDIQASNSSTHITNPSLNDENVSQNNIIPQKKHKKRKQKTIHVDTLSLTVSGVAFYLIPTYFFFFAFIFSHTTSNPTEKKNCDFPKMHQTTKKNERKKKQKTGICAINTHDRNHFPSHLNDGSDHFNMLRGKQTILAQNLTLSFHNESENIINSHIATLQYDFVVQLPPVLPCSFNGHFIQYFYICEVNATIFNVTNKNIININNPNKAKCRVPFYIVPLHQPAARIGTQGLSIQGSIIHSILFLFIFFCFVCVFHLCFNYAISHFLQKKEKCAKVRRHKYKMTNDKTVGK